MTGWDSRLLHWRLGGLLAGFDDPKSEWSSTAELGYYHYERRVAAGVDPDLAEILADAPHELVSFVLGGSFFPYGRIRRSCAGSRLGNRRRQSAGNGDLARMRRRAG